jgi:hypothetical protein
VLILKNNALTGSIGVMQPIREILHENVAISFNEVVVDVKLGTVIGLEGSSLSILRWAAAVL